MIVELVKSSGFTGELGSILGPPNDTECIPVHSLDVCSLSFCSIIRHLGSLCEEEIRQLMEMLQESRASPSCNIKAYIGTLDFVWLGSLALLPICCATFF